jgi:hypothetical protein
VQYNCHVFSIATASLQCTVLVVEHKWKQMHVLDAMAIAIASRLQRVAKQQLLTLSHSFTLSIILQ